MHRSTDRILTTHVGSLIRPEPLRQFLREKEAGRPFDQAAYAKCLRESVAEVVRQQAEIGIDVISDGEFGKAISWSQYALFRLGGFERRPFKPTAGNPFTRGADRTRFAEFYAELDSRDRVETVLDSVAVGPITYTGQAELAQDIDDFKAALRHVKVVEGFLPVAAPASVIPDRKNEYYKNDDELQEAIGNAMHTEYKMIIDAGLLVQLDDARAAVSYDRMVPPKTLADYRKWLAKQVEIINHAIKGLPREKIRYHVCWGSWPGPHSTDVPFGAIADLVLKVRAGAYSIEAANPRHEHEWTVWQDRKLPDGTRAHSRHHQPRHQHRRASRTGGAAHRAACAPRRPRERDRQHRLRLRAGHLFRARASADHVGEACRAGRRRAHRQQGAVAARRQASGRQARGQARRKARGTNDQPPARWRNVRATRSSPAAGDPG